MRQWLKVHTQHIKVCLEQAKKRSSQGVSDIRKWINPAKVGKADKKVSQASTARDRPKPKLHQKPLISWLTRLKQKRAIPVQESKYDTSSNQSVKMWYQTTLGKSRPWQRHMRKPSSHRQQKQVAIHLAEITQDSTRTPVPRVILVVQGSPSSGNKLNQVNSVSGKVQATLTGQSLDRAKKKFEKWRDNPVITSANIREKQQVKTLLSSKKRNRHIQ